MALGELAAIWLDAADRDAINASVDRIDSLLASSPLEAGESRWGDIRILFELPLGALFHAEPDGRRALVLAVWRVPSGPTRRRSR